VTTFEAALDLNDSLFMSNQQNEKVSPSVDFSGADDADIQRAASAWGVKASAVLR